MYSTKEDLESFDDDWPLLQRQRYFPGYRSLQRHIRFCDSHTPNAMPLETTHAAEEEGAHDDYLCDWFLVSISILTRELSRLSTPLDPQGCVAPPGFRFPLTGLISSSNLLCLVHA